MKKGPAGQRVNSLVGARIGKFEIIAEIGTGGMASVYLARSSGSAGFQRLVAIKVMHPHLSADDEFVEMFLDEARVAATIHHPNVIPILDVGIEDGLIFLIMDYVEGDSLSSVEKVAVNLRRRIPIGIILRVVLDALQGLHAAHELCDDQGNHLKIIHRDVSPQNIMIAVDGSARIVDFGIAKAESRVATTKVGMIKGKLNFMAPEQLKAGTLDRRVDIFGMGVTVWEAVTLRRLFAGQNDFDTARRILAGEYLPLVEFDPKIPQALDEIIVRALRPNPDERWSTADEMAEAIETMLSSHIASRSDVAQFISGVAVQKLDSERAAVRSTAASPAPYEDHAGDLSSTLVERGHATIGEEISQTKPTFPSTETPRARPGERSGTRKSALRPPTMAMPVPSQRPAPAPIPEPAAATLPIPGMHEGYDDDGDTQVLAALRKGPAPKPAARQSSPEPIRPSRTSNPHPPPKPAAPPPESDEFEDSLSGGRTVFDPLPAALRPASVSQPAPAPIRPSAPTPPAPQLDEANNDGETWRGAARWSSPEPQAIAPQVPSQSYAPPSQPPQQPSYEGYPQSPSQPQAYELGPQSQPLQQAVAQTAASSGARVWMIFALLFVLAVAAGALTVILRLRG